MNIFPFVKMMNCNPAEFATDEAAEDYVVAYERGVANVVKGGVIFSTYFGKAHERKESK